jgi:hypothetical protein
VLVGGSMDTIAPGCRPLTSKRATTTITKIDNTRSTVRFFEVKRGERSLSVINLGPKLRIPLSIRVDE